jgi:hypothetical protein
MNVTWYRKLLSYHVGFNFVSVSDLTQFSNVSVSEAVCRLFNKGCWKPINQGSKSHIYRREMYYLVFVRAAKTMQCTVRSQHWCVEMFHVGTIHAATVNVCGIV